MVDTMPSPVVSPSPEATPFWQAASRHELALPFCPACDAFFFYPRAFCPRCGARDIQWRRCSGRGRIHTFCIQHHTSVPGLVTAVPFVTAIIELEEGPRLMSFLVDVAADPSSVRCEMPVEATFIDLPDGQSLPAFRPATTTR